MFRSFRYYSDNEDRERWAPNAKTALDTSPYAHRTACDAGHECALAEVPGELLLDLDHRLEENFRSPLVHDEFRLTVEFRRRH
jgi:hypothetical protein